jgi:hypothetical protein
MTDGTFDAMHRGAAEPAISFKQPASGPNRIMPPKQRGARRHNIDRHSGE